ncbi:MAG: phosphoglucosamine mutase [Erysipelotrichaceae bacterium]|nr:phosphoglucosamine mutase [Erysipelotrichaceae bacterium]
MHRFGTDGIRGKANQTLKVTVAYKIGCYLGYYFSQQGKDKILIGKDTRRSSSMLESALAAGIVACGCDVYELGVCPTPSVAYLVRRDKFACGVMISASHNPYYDNGIKVFSSRGTKLEREVEEKIEAYINQDEELELCTGDAIGEIYSWSDGLDEYLNWLEDLVPLNLSQFRIAIDAANGSATTTAYRLLTRMGADCTLMNSEPNGLNINTQCGSTHPEGLVETMLKGKYDLGLAFDGDADRLIAVAPDGQLIDGDKIIYCCGKYLNERNELTSSTVVTTVMANLGLFKKLEEEHIECKVTQVGDKYVYECMNRENYDLGGEQSGHIIFKKCASTGDGLLTALKLLEVMSNTKKTINELTDDLFIYPQLLVNVKVHDKEKAMKDSKVVEACKRIEEELHGEGRILVRPSGTEPLVRVMVEAKTDGLCNKYVYEVVDIIEKNGY